MTIVSNHSTVQSDPFGGFYAPSWKRFIANFLDVMVVLSMCFAISSMTDVWDFDRLMGPLSLVIVVNVLYLLVCELRLQGVTLGKWLTGLMVVRLDGRPIDWRVVCKRTVFRLLSPALLMLPYLLIFITPRSQAAHDWLTQTAVVNGKALLASRAGQEQPLKASTPPPAIEPDLHSAGGKERNLRRLRAVLGTAGALYIFALVLATIALGVFMAHGRGQVVSALDELAPVMRHLEHEIATTQQFPQQIDLEKMRKSVSKSALSNLRYDPSSGSLHLSLDFIPDDDVHLSLFPVRGIDPNSPQVFTWVCRGKTGLPSSFIPRSCMTYFQATMKLLNRKQAQN